MRYQSGFMGSAVGIVLLCVGLQAVGQDVQKSKPSPNFSPRCLYDIFGILPAPTPDLEWQWQNGKDKRSVSLPVAPLISSNADVIGGPAGTEAMFVYRNAPTNHCVDAATYPAFSDVFDTTITTGPGSKFLQVIYSCQANVGNGALSVDGPALRIIVTQGATVPCANTETLPFLVTRSLSGVGSKSMVTYSGFVTVDSSTSTRVQVQVSKAYSPTVAQVCYNNLILRY